MLSSQFSGYLGDRKSIYKHTAKHTARLSSQTANDIMMAKKADHQRRKGGIVFPWCGCIA